jgi:Ca2+-binding EF-hand superfamily protein
MLKQTLSWRCGVLLGALALLAGGAARPQDEKSAGRPGAGQAKAADEAPAPEAVQLLRLNVRAFLKQYDSDKDGKLSRKEVEAVFDHFDRDKDGSLDRKELVGAVKELAGGKEVKEDQYVIAFLREFDVNKDGKLSRQEAKVLFDGADTDKDGLLDENEIVAVTTRLLPTGPKAGAADQPPPAAPPETTTPRATTPPVTAPARPRRLARLVGARVVLGRGEALGQVVDVVADEAGRVAYVIVGAGESLVAVPWGAVRYSAEGGAFTVTAQVTRARLSDVSFAGGRYPDFASETWLRSVRAVWGEQALQGRPGPGATEGTRPAPRPTERRPDERRPPGKPPPPEGPGRGPGA